MFPFWFVAVEPMLAAIDPRRVVEVGAHQGEHTDRLLDFLGAESEVHVIDPAPAFDPAEQARAFAGRYVFHEAPSLEVLGGLAPADVVLLDGDHNWYTVYHELRLIDDAARAVGAPFPVLILHDVGWPYGRRDCYYAADRVPAAYRHPHRTAGMAPGRSELLAVGGWNDVFENAEHEGGPRNGVLTAMEDHVAESSRPLRVVVIEAPPGLAVVVDRDGWGGHPPLAQVLGRLEEEVRAGTLDSAELSKAYRPE